MLRLLLILQVAVMVMLCLPASIAVEDIGAPEQQAAESVAEEFDLAESAMHSNPAYSGLERTTPFMRIISQTTAHRPHVCLASQHCEDVYTPPPLS
ncbi:hypothetical protein [Turneriella parva]|uniref:Uncharacterized protein n=1 Tax=Turneriella parva (strain ATCC BAA-1111 / DSM 21527 / NCTC 11395 / H) TaxID=869212 RepID=I4B8H7_TURPD|nr:hypothetical protein [Turneriella parva]AFM13584.1 hypothetical protein Turpa_2945 [Turneriella parva DSM 21527]